MFKNRAVQMKLVKDEAKSATTPSPCSDASTKLINRLSNLDAKTVVLGAVATYASVKTINTLCQIAINIAPKN